MSKTKLILAQENHFPVVFEERKSNAWKNHKNNYTFFSPTFKNGVDREKCIAILPQRAKKFCLVIKVPRGFFLSLKRALLNFLLFV